MTGEELEKSDCNEDEIDIVMKTIKGKMMGFIPHIFEKETYMYRKQEAHEYMVYINAVYILILGLIDKALYDKLYKADS